VSARERMRGALDLRQTDDERRREKRAADEPAEEFVGDRARPMQGMDGAATRSVRRGSRDRTAPRGRRSAARAGRSETSTCRHATKLVVTRTCGSVEEHRRGQVDEPNATRIGIDAPVAIGVQLPHQTTMRSTDLGHGGRRGDAENGVEIVLRFEVADLHAPYDIAERRGFPLRRAADVNAWRARRTGSSRGRWVDSAARRLILENSGLRKELTPWQ